MELNASGEATDIECRVNPHRDYRRWGVKAQPIVETGEVTHIVGFLRDITDRRSRERKLRVMDNLLRHNLHNDMNVILGHAEIAREQVSAEVADSMDVVIETGEKFLETAAKEQEIIDVLVGIDDRERVDLVALLAQVLESFRSESSDASVTVTRPDAVDAVALPDLRRALDEFLENAAEYADADPVIEIEVRSFADHIEIEIRDNAPSIPGNEFKPLVEKNESDEIYHGTGLGLRLVSLVVGLSNGNIDFDCDGDGNGNGNVFTISQPRARE